jgi:hypothetical protein
MVAGRGVRRPALGASVGDAGETTSEAGDMERSNRVRKAAAAAACVVVASTIFAGQAAAGGVYAYLGLGGAGGPVAPSCPGKPCAVVTQTTGFQASIAGRHLTMAVSRPGRVTSWTLALAAPNPAEIAYFDGAADGPARAGLVVLRHTVDYRFRLIDASPVVALEPYFGGPAKFVLTRPLPVRAGDIVALTVPTWAPVLATGLDAGTAWRASRPLGACNSLFTQTAATQFGALTNSECVYATARLAYGATVSVGP